jgi:hypothetical protein
VATTAWLRVALVTLGGRFSERGIAVGVAYAVALLLAVSFGVNKQSVLDNPPLVIAPLALMVAIGMFQTVLMRSDVKYRTQAILDPLTGVLNRMALDLEPRRQRLRARRALRLRGRLRACGRFPLRRQAPRPQPRRAGHRRRARGCRLTPVPTAFRRPAEA